MWASFTRTERNLILTLVALIAGGSALTLFDGHRSQQRVFPAGSKTAAHTQRRALGAGADGDAGASVNPPSPVMADGRIDINTATADVIETIPGIGPTKANAIIEHRTRFGPFRSIQDLDKVSGIGPATLRQIEPHITLGAAALPLTPALSPVAAPAGSFQSARQVSAPPPSPAVQVVPTMLPAASASVSAAGLININTATHEELLSLPSIGEVKARAIIDYRATHGPFSDPAQIKNVHGIGQKTYETIRGRITVR